MGKNESKLCSLKEMRTPLRPNTRLGLGALFAPFVAAMTFMPGPIGYKLRQFYYRMRFKGYGKNSLIDVGVVVFGEENISIGDYTWIDSYVCLDARLGEIRIGKRIHIAQGCVLIGSGGLVVGDYVGMGPAAKVYTCYDRFDADRNDTGSIVDEDLGPGDMVKAPVTISRDACIGSGAIILPGVTIGEGAVVAPNSVVGEDLESWSVAVGSPARIIGKRDKVTVPDL